MFVAATASPALDNSSRQQARDPSMHLKAVKVRAVVFRREAAVL